jgi:hypothetical protein
MEAWFMLQDRGPFRRAALKPYISQMSTPDPKGIFDDHVAEILEQQGFSWEEDPRSIYDPQQLYTALERYATSWDDYESIDDHVRFGIGMAYKIFAKPKHSKCLRVLTDSEVVSDALKLDKSAGLPSLGRKRDNLVYAFDREAQIRQGIKAPNPCVAYKRTQKGNKTRLVWGYPLEMTIMESRFARPLINEFLKRRTPMAFGMTKTEIGAKIHKYVKEDPGTTVCLDYSKFDSTIPKTLIKEAFRILQTWFSNADVETFGWDTAVRYFITTPIVMPDGHLYTGKNHGVPSGSYFTQMIDSVVNVILAYTLRSRFGFDFKPTSIYVLGDDVIFSVRGKIDLKAWATYLSKFGVIIHDDEKTVIGIEHFIGAFWDKGKPDVPLDEALPKAVFPERYRNYEGQPYRGAEDVLRGYASSFLSAIKMIPTGGNLLLLPQKMRQADYPRKYRDDNLHYLTGSDRFLSEELKLLKRDTPYRDRPAPLSLRIML